MKKKSYKNSLFIVVFVIVVFFIIKVSNGASSPSVKTSTQQNIITKSTNIPTQQEISENLKLSHSDLLRISKEDPNKIINKTYGMVLYLEQAPTETQAEFMTQPDDNSSDTILVTCNMSLKDLKNMDGMAAQNQNYKPYNIKVTFSTYNSNVGLYYEAKCVIK